MSWSRYGNLFKRAGGRLQTPGRNVQIAGGGLDILVPHQNLNGAQIRATFEHVGCKAVPQGMRRDTLFDAGPPGCMLHRLPNDLGSDGLVGAPAIGRAGLRRSRKMTHLCSVKVTHLKNRISV